MSVSGSIFLTGSEIELKPLEQPISPPIAGFRIDRGFDQLRQRNHDRPRCENHNCPASGIIEM
jgi:hypothetical protein